MINLCSRCLTELAKNEKNCPVCGLKRSKNYKKPLLISSSFLIPFIALFAIFSYIASSQTKEKVADKFYIALSERNVNTLKKLIVHEDGRAITSLEAEAITKLITKIGEIEVEKLFYPIENNNVLNTYKMTASPVSLATVERPLHISIKDLNTKKLMPGNYPVTISYDAVLPSSTTKNLTIIKPNTALINDFNLIDIKVSSIRKFPILFFNNINLKVKDTTVALSELVAMRNFTSIEGQSSEFEIIMSLPWGDISSGNRKYGDQLNIDLLPIVTEEQAEHLRKLTTTTLNHIANKEKSLKNTSEFLQKNPPVFMKKLANNMRITEFEEQSVFSNKNGEIVGAFFYLITDNALEMNALFVYDKPTDRWTLEILFSTDLVDTDAPFNYYKENFHDSFYDKTNLDGLSAEQLNYWLEGFYFSEYIFASNSSLAEQRKIKNYEKNSACATLLDTEVKQVKVLTNDRVTIQSIDYCYGGTNFEVTSTMSRAEVNNWVLESIDHKREID